jgi:hypothetical protein
MAKRGSNGVQAPKNLPNTDLDADVNAAIEACGGDARAAIRALLVANSYLETELEKVLEMVSFGYARGRTRRPPL